MLLRFLCFPLALLAMAGGIFGWMARAAEPAGDAIVRVETSRLAVGVARDTGQLVELRDRVTQLNLAGPATNGGGLWALELGVPGASPLTPQNARRFETFPLAESGGRRFVWRDFGLAAAPELSVEVTVRLDPHEALSRWQLAVRQKGALGLKTLRFPRLVNLPPQTRERLAVPVWMGQLAENPRVLLRPENGPPRRFEWRYPGHLSLQCLTVVNDGGAGLYAACEDSANQLKDFAVFGTADAGLNFEVTHHPEAVAAAQADYTLPYAMILGTVTGDWFQAAARYRTWATNQAWARESRLRRGLTPAWLTNTALWVWNRGESAQVLAPAVALQQELKLPVSVFWHWWHGCAYDTGFPEYLPPREGKAGFQAALEQAQAHDVRALVYMNQRLWGMTTASWTNEQAERFAVKAADGQVRPEVYNTFTKQPCASMCMGTEFWRHKYAGLATEAVTKLGVDGIYMDQACSSLACYDATHGHAIGGGTYWMRGFQTLAADIRQRCAPGARPVLAGEGCGENWLPHLDLMLSLEVSRERYAGADGWQTIPFFHAVYHDYGVFYGNYSSLTLPPYDALWPAEFAPAEPLKLLDRKFSGQFRLEQARAFVWGQQPTIANFLPEHLQTRASELEYALRLAKIRARALPYLLHGQLLAPPVVTAPSAEIPMSRLSIYAGQQGGVREFTQRHPLALAAGWRSPAGGVAVALTSVSETPLTPEVRVDAVAWGLPARGKIYRVDEKGRTLLGSFRRDQPVLTPALGAFDACVLELVPE